MPEVWAKQAKSEGGVEGEEKHGRGPVFPRDASLSLSLFLSPCFFPPGQPAAVYPRRANKPRFSLETFGFFGRKRGEGRRSTTWTGILGLRVVASA